MVRMIASISLHLDFAPSFLSDGVDEPGVLFLVIV